MPPLSNGPSRFSRILAKKLKTHLRPEMGSKLVCSDAVKQIQNNSSDYMSKIRNSSSPLEESSRYVLLDEATVNRLIDAKLTAAQYRAVLYFSLVDPFGNRFVDTGGQMARQRLGISKSTYYEALAALEREQLFEFEDVSLKVRNRVGSKSPEKCSVKPIVREIEPKSEISETQSLEPFNISISTSLQYHSIDPDLDQNDSLRERKDQVSIFEIEPEYRD